MARYSAAVRTPASTTGTTICDLRTTATDRVFLLELGIFSSAATLGFVGLIRPNAVGTASTTTLGQADDPGNPAGTGLVGTAWSSAPTIAGSPIYLRRITFPAAQASGVIWTFGGGGLVVPISSSLLLWNFGGSTNPALDVYMVWDE